MIDIAKNNAKYNNILNIEYHCSDASYFEYDKKFDIIFISGLLLYMSNNQITLLSDNLKQYSKKGTKLIVREPVGINESYLILDRYSEDLDTNYSALYRTREELITIFEDIDFKLNKDEDMFQDGSPLNKWDETKLRVYLFEK